MLNDDNIDKLNLDFYKEQLEAKEDMLSRSSKYLTDISNELETKNNELTTTNNELFESIRFAQIIQNSLLPNVEVLKIFFKDASYSIVQQIGIGGDSIFIKNMSHGVIFGLMDFTGHGIPAAMLSISGSLILNELTSVTELEDPSNIFKLLSQQLFYTFNNKNLSLAQMEGIIFYHSSKDNKISYCSAKGKGFLLKQNGDLIELHSSKLSIAESIGVNFEVFELETKLGDKLFLYSDGLIDQFGGVRDKKFSKAKLKSILIKNSHLSVNNLKLEITKEHIEWRSTNTQTDDISFMIIEF